MDMNAWNAWQPLFYQLIAIVSIATKEIMYWYTRHYAKMIDYSALMADASYTLHEAHEIAEEVHNVIEQNFPKVKHIMVHVNPAE